MYRFMEKLMNAYYLELKEVVSKIKYYRSRQRETIKLSVALYYDDLIWNAFNRFDYLIQQIYQGINDEQFNNENPINVSKQQRERQFTINELANYDGTNGKATYVAVYDIVYDVSLVPSWGGGTHFGLIGGRDLTKEFESCHDKNEIIDKLPIIGVLI